MRRDALVYRSIIFDADVSFSIRVCRFEQSWDAEFTASAAAVVADIKSVLHATVAAAAGYGREV